MSLMRNKLTVFESRNQLLEQEKSDLTETVNMLSSAKSEMPGKTAERASRTTSRHSEIEVIICARQPLWQLVARAKNHSGN